jgi:hypothetical protein
MRPEFHRPRGPSLRPRIAAAAILVTHAATPIVPFGLGAPR